MSVDNKIPLVAVVGPTASGKTGLGVELAKQLGGEVISADSMQIYKDMDIATAKPTPEETDGVVHHLIGFLPPSESFSVAQYVELARKCIIDIHSRGKLPIVVGGTGLYVSSLLNNISFSEDNADYALRERLAERANRLGSQSIIDELRTFDPESAERMHPNNLKRIIRAIEIYRTTGITMTEQNRRSRLVEPPYNAVKIGLKARDRQYLYDRINRRVDVMVQQGLLDEAKRVLSGECSMTAQKAIGYKELVPYFDGTAKLDDCLEKLKMESRRYAKRQLTWFLRDEEIKWFDIDTFEDYDEFSASVLKYAENMLGKRG